MTSTLEGDSPIPLHVAFDDESQSAVKKKKKVRVAREDGIDPIHRKGLDVEDRIGNEEEHKKKDKHKDKKDKNRDKKDKSEEKKEKRQEKKEKRQEKKEKKEKSQEKYEKNQEVKDKSEDKKAKEKVRLLSEARPDAKEPTQKDVGDKPLGYEEPDKKTKGNEGDNISDGTVASEKTNKTDKSDGESNKMSSSKKKGQKQETRGDENPERMVIRAATRRDFYEDPDCRRYRNDGGSNASINNSKRQEICSRESYRRSGKEKKDACTGTRDGLLGPCQYLGGLTKESCRDLCEQRKDGEHGGGRERMNSRGWDQWCDDSWCRGNSREDRARSVAVPSRLDAPSSESTGERGDNWKGNRKSTKETSTDEMTQLKTELTILQTELDKLKECLKAAAIAAEKNKSTITKMKEHIRCNFPYCFPDFARIREKLNCCHVMKMKLCRDFNINSNRDHWRKDFECLMSELNSIKSELEKMRKDQH